MEAGITKLPINKIKPNPKNPRVIKDDNFKKLVNSLKTLPIMLEKRPVLIDEDNMIIGGNMRYRAAKEADMKELPVMRFTREDADKNNQQAKATDPNYIEKTYEEQVSEMIIKDNVSGGEWDWEALVADWNIDLLDLWGLDSKVGNLASLNEVNSSDESAEWIGMPEFEAKEKPYTLVIQFDDLATREQFVDKVGIKVATKGEKAAWSTWWPYKEKERLIDKKYE